jgi:hypothetical protein
VFSFLTDISKLLTQKSCDFFFVFRVYEAVQKFSAFDVGALVTVDSTGV